MKLPETLPADTVRVDRLRGIVTARTWVQRPLREVFEFFSEARNLERITPDFLNFRVLSMTTESIGEGTCIDYRLKIRGLPVRWRSRIENWDPPFFFSDRQLRGPYQTWFHEHHFEEK